MESTFIQTTSSIRNAFTSFKERLDIFVSLEALEFFIRVKISIGIIKSYNITHMNKVWSHVI